MTPAGRCRRACSRDAPRRRGREVGVVNACAPTRCVVVLDQPGPKRQVVGSSPTAGPRSDAKIPRDRGQGRWGRQPDRDRRPGSGWPAAAGPAAADTVGPGAAAGAAPRSGRRAQRGSLGSATAGRAVPHPPGQRGSSSPGPPTCSLCAAVGRGASGCCSPMRHLRRTARRCHQAARSRRPDCRSCSASRRSPRPWTSTPPTLRGWSAAASSPRCGSGAGARGASRRTRCRPGWRKPASGPRPSRRNSHPPRASRSDSAPRSPTPRPEARSPNRHAETLARKRRKSRASGGRAERDMPLPALYMPLLGASDGRLQWAG